MRSILRATFAIAVAMLAIGFQPTTVSAQSVSTFLGGSGTTSTTQQSWTTAGNWNTATVPTGTAVWAQINSSTSPILRILYTSTSVGSGTSLTVGAISFLPTLAVSSGSTYAIQNNSAGTKGTLKFYGIDTTIDGTARRIILDNQTSLSDVNFTQTLAGQDFELYSSGVINVAAGTQLTLTPLIRDGSGSGTVTKIGRGVLSLAGSSTSSTYAGGFSLEGGIVQWASSGVSGTNPFGSGPLTLRSGTLRSTTTTGKSINSNVVLDGSVTLGSTDPSFNGNITVNSSSGSLATTIASNSIVTIAGGSTAWNQSTSGTGSLTLAGSGQVRFTSLSTLAHTGSTVVQAGTLNMQGNMTSASAVSVFNAATLLGTGTISGATSILSGGTFSPGTQGGATGVFTFGSGGLSLAGQSLMEVAGVTRGTQYDGVDISGPLGYGGSLLLQFSGTLADNTTVELFKGFSSQSGSFSSITVSGSYTGSLAESSGVWTGVFGAQTMTFTNSTGNLVVVPEPAVVGLLGSVGMVVTVAGLRRRRASRQLASRKRAVEV